MNSSTHYQSANTEKDFKVAQEAVELAKSKFLSKEYDASVESMVRACELYSARFGPDAPECAAVYFFYGEVLIELDLAEKLTDKEHSTSQSEVTRPKAESPTIHGQNTKSLKRKIEDGSEDEKSDQDEDSDSDLSEYEPTNEDYELAEKVLNNNYVPSHLDQSRNMFELAKSIYTRNFNHDPAFKNTKIAECLFHLGKISIEHENYRQAIAELNESIKLHTRWDEPLFIQITNLLEHAKKCEQQSSQSKTKRIDAVTIPIKMEPSSLIIQPNRTDMKMQMAFLTQKHKEHTQRLIECNDRFQAILIQFPNNFRHFVTKFQQHLKAQEEHSNREQFWRTIQQLKSLTSKKESDSHFMWTSIEAMAFQAKTFDRQLDIFSNVLVGMENMIEKKVRIVSGTMTIADKKQFLMTTILNTDKDFANSAFHWLLNHLGDAQLQALLNIFNRNQKENCVVIPVQSVQINGATYSAQILAIKLWVDPGYVPKQSAYQYRRTCQQALKFICLNPFHFHVSGQSHRNCQINVRLFQDKLAQYQLVCEAPINSAVKNSSRHDPSRISNEQRDREVAISSLQNFGFDSALGRMKLKRNPITFNYLKTKIERLTYDVSILLNLNKRYVARKLTNKIINRIASNNQKVLGLNNSDGIFQIDQHEFSQLEYLCAFLKHLASSILASRDNFVNIELFLLGQLISCSTFIKPNLISTIYCFFSPFFDFKNFNNMKTRLGLAYPAPNRFDFLNYIFYYNSDQAFTYYEDLRCLSFSIIYYESENRSVLETIGWFQSLLNVTQFVRRSPLLSNYNNNCLFNDRAENYYDTILENRYHFNRLFTFLNRAEIELTKIQKFVFNGIMLGDGCISGYLSFAFSQSIGHSSYFRDVKNIFLSVLRSATSKPRPARLGMPATIENVLEFPKTKFLISEKSRWYPRGIKIIPQDISQTFSLLSLIYLICDDGCRSSGTISIATHCFERDHLLNRLIPIFNDRYNLNTHISKTSRNEKVYHSVYMPRIDRENLFNLARHFVPLGMLYKFSAHISIQQVIPLNRGTHWTSLLLKNTYRYPKVWVRRATGEESLGCFICGAAVSSLGSHMQEHIKHSECQKCYMTFGIEHLQQHIKNDSCMKMILHECSKCGEYMRVNSAASHTAKCDSYSFIMYLLKPN